MYAIILSFTLYHSVHLALRIKYGFTPNLVLAHPVDSLPTLAHCQTRSVHNMLRKLLIKWSVMNNSFTIQIEFLTSSLKLSALT